MPSTPVPGWLNKPILYLMLVHNIQFSCQIVSKSIGHSCMCFVKKYRSYSASEHYNDVIICAMASQVTSLTIAYSNVYSGAIAKKTSKLRVTSLCVGNSPTTGDFHAQKTSNVENVSIWWRHHENDSRANASLEMQAAQLEAWFMESLPSNL